jgi:hypothetical protein
LRIEYYEKKRRIIFVSTVKSSELHGLRKPDFDSDSGGVGVVKKIFGVEIGMIENGVQIGVRLVQKLGISILI